VAVVLPGPAAPVPFEIWPVPFVKLSKLPFVTRLFACAGAASNKTATVENAIAAAFRRFEIDVAYFSIITFM
jgi:hypothetical protein